MSRNYRPYYPDQDFLLPPSPRDWLPDTHIAFFISDAVDVMDLDALHERYGQSGPGKQAFDPSMMIKVLLYAYASGVFSSRRIALRLHEDLAFRFLAAENFPSHRTICDFRKRHLEEFKNLFVQVVQLAREAQLVGLGTIAIDGTKIRANASKRKAMTYKRMKEEETRLREEIGELTERARSLDDAEDERYGSEGRGDDIPQELARRENRLAAIQAAKQRLQKRQQEADDEKGRKPGDDEPGSGKAGKPYKRRYGVPEEKTQDNFTDPQSRIMKTSSEGFQQCYNAQAAVDADEGIIIATGMTQSASDYHQLEPVLDRVEQNLGEPAEVLLADAGYASEDNLQSLEDRKIDGYVATGREKKISEGKTPNRKTALGRMAAKLRTKPGKERYRKRKHIGEPPFGWIKRGLGFRQFSLRGFINVTCEWDLVCAALNLKRMASRIQWN
jgi:transposase